MNEEIFQRVFDKIEEFLPEDWKKMVFYAMYSKGSYSMKFYYKSADKGYVDCFSIPGITKPELLTLFNSIDKTLSVQRKELGKAHTWTTLTIQVDSDGKLKAEFDYNDHSSDMIAYENDWERKYLH